MTSFPPNARSRFFTRSRMRAYIFAGVFLFCVWAFWEIAEDFPEGRFRTFDEAILRGLRTAADPAIPIGPSWLKEMMRDISALGSGVVLTLGVVAVLIYLLLQQRRRAAVAVAGACVGGVALDLALKSVVERPRPSIVPHLTDVATTSFPSGHTLLSAIIYLSVGSMIAQRSASRGMRLFAFGFPALLTGLVGVSRVYLGVHYPTDVLGGWVAAVAWTLVCAAVQAGIERRRSPAPEPSGN